MEAKVSIFSTVANVFRTLFWLLLIVLLLFQFFRSPSLEGKRLAAIEAI
jgi:hypothetical protein